MDDHFLSSRHELVNPRCTLIWSMRLMNKIASLSLVAFLCSSTSSLDVSSLLIFAWWSEEKTNDKLNISSCTPQEPPEFLLLLCFVVFVACVNCDRFNKWLLPAFHSLETLHLFFFSLVPFLRQANISSISFASNCVLVDKERTRTEKRYHSSRRDLSQSKKNEEDDWAYQHYSDWQQQQEERTKQVNGIDGELLLIDQSQHMQWSIHIRGIWWKEFFFLLVTSTCFSCMRLFAWIIKTTNLIWRPCFMIRWRHAVLAKSFTGDWIFACDWKIVLWRVR